MSEKRYVVGFAIEDAQVLLIRKARPAWQAGKLNGVGGKIERAERSIDAMVREFREETQIATAPDCWELRAQVAWNDAHVDFYVGYLPLLSRAESNNDEPLAIVGLRTPPPDVLPNLRWLIPLCLDGTTGVAAIRIYAPGSKVP